MKICFVSAMSAEVEWLLSNSKILSDSPLGYGHVYRIVYEGKDAYVCVSGIGKVLAGASIAAMAIAHPDIDAFVNLGIGGSLHADVAPLMSCVASKRLVQHDVDTVGLGDEYGYLSTPKYTYMEADPFLMERVEDVCAQLKLPFCFGTMASGDQFITDEEKKQIIVSRFDALMVDMEAAAMAEIALGFEKPFVAVRVVSDAVDHEKEYFEYKPHASKRVCEIAMALLKSIS